jgi:hypothetical protein
MKISIKINKGGLTTNQCRKLSEYLQSFNTIDIISLLEGDKHIYKINDEILVEIKRNYN